MDAKSELQPPPSFASLLESGPVGLMLDFDGTLIEIADGPDMIKVPQDLASRIDALSQRLGGALALVSGRSIENLSRFVATKNAYLAGSHGGQILSPNGTVISDAEDLPQSVQKALAEFANSNGLLHERKSHGAALHFRAKPELEDEAKGFAATLAETHGLSTKHGKCVVELVWPGIDKGGAVEILCANAPFAGTTTIFVGDDFTDEDGFAACNQLGGFGVQVGKRAPTSARYHLGSVGKVYEWLKL